MENSLTPIVKWAQNGSLIYVTVELSDVKDALINFEEDGLVFQGYGHGAKGENTYNFKLEFFDRIDTKKSSYRITDRNVQFNISKEKNSDEWPRLLKSQIKPGWLRIDFDKWKIEESDPDQDLENQIDKISFEQRVQSEIDKAKDDIVIYTKVAWLTLYNLFQFVCFSVIFAKLMYLVWSHRSDAVNYFYEDVSDLLLTCQVAAFVEILNPLFGIVKTSVRAPFMQVFGRNFILFILIVPEKQLHNDFVVLVLFISWSTIEVFRYPFYLFTLYHYNSKVLAWLRYSLWLPLYPVGFISEAAIMYKSLPYIDEKNRMEFNLPNRLNFSFTLKQFTQLYLFFFIPLCLYLMKHMWVLRQRKIGGTRRKRKEKKL